MSTFLIIFFIIYGGMHLYALSKLRYAFSFGHMAALPLYLFIVLMILAPLFVRFLERADYLVPTRLLAFFSYSWMGVLLLFVSMELIIDLYRISISLATHTIKKDFARFIPPAGISFVFPLVLSMFIAIYGILDADNIRVERVSIKSPKIPKELGSIKIAQISDLHIGLTVMEGRVKKVLDVIRIEKPDMLVSTGDLIDGQAPALDGISELFHDVRPKLGKYAVTGNHEYYAGLDNTMEFTGKAGFVLLRGASAAVSEVINIAGVDDGQGRSFNDYKGEDEKSLLEGLPDDRFTLLLKHRPLVDEGSVGLFDLQLSGHTHGGQIFPFGLAVRYFFPHMRGLAELGNGSKLYTSRGTGTWGPPFRFLSPPEVTIIEISH
ncbi:MAG: metallophosphoesterase [bacterium]|nr:metallophosphoesterase [bacterium]